MSYVIMNLVTHNLYRPTHIEAQYNTLRGARGMATRLNKDTITGKKEWNAISYSEFTRLFDPYVEVKSLMTGQTVMIRKSEKGGCCDPSQERFWSM